MARPIKETPTLYGEDARRFEYEMQHLKPESKEEIEDALNTYNKFKSIATFDL